MQCQNPNRNWNRTLLFRIRWCMVQIMSLARRKRRPTLKRCIHLAAAPCVCRVRTAKVTGLMWGARRRSTFVTPTHQAHLRLWPCRMSYHHLQKCPSNRLALPAYSASFGGLKYLVPLHLSIARHFHYESGRGPRPVGLAEMKRCPLICACNALHRLCAH
jgi:hypothetical protein